MELTLKSRGVEVTDQLRRLALRKLAKLSRLAPDASRVEVEVISERNRRQNGAKRIEATLHTRRRVFRAHARGPDVHVALDQLADHLERQVRDARDRRKSRLSAGGNRLQSPRIGPQGS